MKKIHLDILTTGQHGANRSPLVNINQPGVRRETIDMSHYDRPERVS
jgi:hypothetical protein